MKKYLYIPLIAAILSLSACSALTSTSTSSAASAISANLDLIEPVVATATTLVLDLSTSPADKITKAKIISGIGAALYQFTTGTVPTATQLNADLNNSIPTGVSHWLTYIDSISALYGNYFSQVNGNAKVAIEVLNAIAVAIQTAAAPVIAGN